MGTPLKEGNSFTHFSIMVREIPPLRCASVGMENCDCKLRLNTTRCLLLIRYFLSLFAF